TPGTLNSRASALRTNPNTTTNRTAVARIMVLPHDRLAGHQGLIAPLELEGDVSAAARGVVGHPVQLTGAGALERREHGEGALGGVEHDQSVLLAHGAGPAARLGDV